jgi:uncharacterized protein YjbK
MRHIEIEFKQMLTEQQHHALLKHFNQAQLIEQNNTYYLYQDHPIDLVARIRTIHNSAQLTFKQKAAEGVIEHHFAMNAKDEDIFNRKDVVEFLSSLNLSSRFYSLGSLFTLRHLVIENNQEICIDENHYLDQIDYELEVETLGDAHRAHARFMEICQKFSIDVTPTSSKFSRYLKRKGL